MLLLNTPAILFVIGLVLSKLALFMYIPAIVAFVTASHGFWEFGTAIIITHSCAFGLLAYGRRNTFQLGVRDMFLITTLVWGIASAFAALPFVFINHISFSDAYFETMSGLTTTGSTVLSGLDDMAPSILLWRSLLQWLGGIGFIVMGVAILPMLNVGGMRLFQTESSDWSEKSAPRTKQVALHIVQVYVSLSMLCIMGYLAAGMDLFDAINHALTTISTGGYSTSDSSMNGFSTLAHWNAIVFMFAGGLPFLLFVRALKRKTWQPLWADAQVRGFAKLTLFVSAIVAVSLHYQNHYQWLDALRVGLFNVVSVMTTTGFGLGDFTHWGPAMSVVFAFLMLTGACSGSTSGGVKLFRFQVAIALFNKHMMQLIHPSGMFIQRYNGAKVTESIVRSVIAFALVFFVTVLVTALLLAILGLDATTSLSGAITAVANVGPGIGSTIGPSGNFASLPAMAKWILSVAMLMGRLEIITVLVLFYPAYWRS
ncbi:TrkH family potassium uptake protein [Thaumasiovibrio sp. DFM-14]|uniref:TrkH family potassium uptake protein n=1 Tax=Thaumasiovibrio sp. DFM-14 TaxID=3384792 RepID=UPI0039A2BCF6